jgi:ABC-2 type transport system ATP-binding protein
MRKIIAAMRPDKAIVISTHLLEEVEAVCSRAIIIAHGRLLADATPAELARRSRHHNAVRLAVAGGDVAQIQAELLRLPAVAAAETVEDGEGEGLLIFPRDGQDVVADVADLARAHRWQVTLLRVEHGRLDDVFRAITTAPVEPTQLADAA